MEPDIRTAIIFPWERLNVTAKLGAFFHLMWPLEQYEIVTKNKLKHNLVLLRTFETECNQPNLKLFVILCS
ncbi:hypothetical protein BpHYR1_033787 [Brachionus plicatilis]|uniref:Uncharacterized protein n=1 Tax=Brachionus plicatilis TaxID=10195 RepID=A0A3M7QV79_BRAPC|nr:hypothetical protein BpHYR1_033787 [Brachionus plicatilis]